MRSFFIVSTLCLVLAACKKGGSDDTTPTPPPPPPPVQQTVLSLSAAQATPGDVLEIKANRKMTDKEINISFNGTTLKGYAKDDSAYVFIVPVVAAGPVSLAFPTISNSNTLSLTISAYTTISNPQVVVNDFVARRNRMMDSLTVVRAGYNFQPSPESITIINQIKQEWDAQLVAMSASDKELLAYALKKNMPDTSTVSFGFSANPSSYYAKLHGVQGDVGDYLVTIAKTYVTAKVICLASIPFVVGTGYAFIAAPNPISGALFLAAWSTFWLSREVAIIRAKEVGSLKGVADAITGADAQRIMAEFNNNTERALSMGVNFRNLAAGDAGLNANLGAAYTAEQQFASEDNGVQGIYTKATSKLDKLKGTYPVYARVIGNRPTGTMNLAIEGADIRVKGVSDSRIGYSTSVAGGIKKIKITSNATAPIDFNLQVAYTRSLDGKEFTKDIACTFKPEMDSTAIYKAAVLGQWQVTLADGTQPTPYGLTLEANGTGYYTASGTKYNMTWSIQKTAAGYFLMDYGFWHPGFSGESRDRLSYPAASFKTYSNYGFGASRLFTR